MNSKVVLLFLCTILVTACELRTSNTEDFQLSNFEYIKAENFAQEYNASKSKYPFEKIEILNSLRLSALAQNDKELFIDYSLVYFKNLHAAKRIYRCEYELFRFISNFESELNAEQLLSVYSIALYNQDYYARKVNSNTDRFIISRLRELIDEGRIDIVEAYILILVKNMVYTEPEYLSLIEEARNIGINDFELNRKLMLFYRENGHYKKALDYMLTLDSLKLKCCNTHYTEYGEIGVTYRYANQLDSAEKYLLKSHDPEQVNINMYHINPCINLGKLYLNAGEFNKAEAYLMDAEVTAVGIRNEFAIQEIFDTYRSLYERFGKKEKLLDALDRHRGFLIEQLLSSSNDYNSSVVLIESIRKKNRAQRLRTLVRVIIAAIALILFSFLIFRILINKRRSKHMKKQIFSKESKLVELNSKLSDERVRSGSKEKMMEAILGDLKEGNQVDRLKLIDKLEDISEVENDWEKFQSGFTLVYPDFYKNLLERNPKLTTLDLKHGSYMKLNLTIPEISKILGINNRSVNIARYRLRHKLNFDSAKALKSFIHQL